MGSVGHVDAPMKNMLVVSKTCDAGKIQSSPLPHGCFVVTGKGKDPGFNLAITRLLEIGCEFFATWGDYSDAEEIIDDLILDAGDMDAVTISLNESLEDAVEFFAHGAFPGLNCVRFVLLICQDAPDSLMLKAISLFEKELNL